MPFEESIVNRNLGRFRMDLLWQTKSGKASGDGAVRKIRIPNFEIRNKSEARQPKPRCRTQRFPFSSLSFEFVSGFDIRISDLRLGRARLRLQASGPTVSA